MAVETTPKGKRSRVRGTPKGRSVDPSAREDVRTLLGDAPRRRDLLIEHLHKIQDRYGHLSAAHLVALAAEMKMAMAEVYEVATFYHHFDVVKEGETPPPELTVRVCDSLSCEMAGAGELLEKLPRILGREVRVLHAPCVGRCESAPVAVVARSSSSTRLRSARNRVRARSSFMVPPMARTRSSNRESTGSGDSPVDRRVH